MDCQQGGGAAPKGALLLELDVRGADPRLRASRERGAFQRSLCEGALSSSEESSAGDGAGADSDSEPDPSPSRFDLGLLRLLDERLADI